MGLALGVDYALFIVSRFREERARGLEKIEAIAATGRTASRAVLFSGTAFVIALTGMLLVPDTILRSLAARRGARRDHGGAGGDDAAAGGALAARRQSRRAAAAVLGRATLRRKAASGERWSTRVQRRPLASLVVSVAILVALALPALDLRTGSAGVRTIPDGYMSKDGFNALEREFGVGTVDSVRGRRRRRHRSGARARGRRDAARSARERFGLPLAGRDDRPERRRCRRRGAGRAETAVTRRRCRRSSGCGRRPCPRRSATRTPRLFVTGETAEIVDYNELMSAWTPDRLPVRARASASSC